MIYVLTGSNRFSLKNRLSDLIAELNAPVNRPSVDKLSLSEISVLLLGENLFSEQQTLILNSLSERKDIFESAIDLMIKNKDTINVILVEEKLDKRTTLYKKLSANAKIEDFKQYTDRDSHLVSKWLQDYTKQKGSQITPQLAQYLLDWVGVDQYRLASAIDNLLLMNEMTKEGVEKYITRTPSSFSFDLFAVAINKDTKKVDQLIDDLKLTQDPYMLMGLLISQSIQLVALSTSKPGDNVAGELGASPYALNNLRRSVKVTKTQANEVVTIFYEADSTMKSTGADPWRVIEIALKKLTQI